MKLLQFFLVILITFAPFSSSAQVEKTALMGAYCFRFAEYTYWYNENDFDNFTILLLTNQTDLESEFKAFSKLKTIKNKPINLIVERNVPDQIGKDVRMIVVSSEMLVLIDKVKDIIAENSILLVTENYPDKKSVMINLYQPDNEKLMFEVNKANMLIRNLIVDPEIMLLGGTAIDIVDLYRKSQIDLERLQIEMKSIGDSLSKTKSQINQTLLELEERQHEIDKQDELLKNQQAELLEGKNEILRSKGELETQKLLVAEQNEQMKEQLNAITLHQKNIELQNDSIEIQLAEITMAKLTLDSLSGEIERQNEYLGSQSLIIKRQRVTIIMTALAGFLALTVLVVLIVSYRGKVRRNRLLKEQKQHIEVINQKMKSVNHHLFGIIARLRETQSQLLTAEKMASLGVLTAGVAHEINNPVNFIYTGINSLAKEYNELIIVVNQIVTLAGQCERLKDEIQELKQLADFDEIVEIIPQTIEDIKVGAQRTADIVKGLRNFSRIDRDNMQLANVHEGIDAALLLLRNKFKNHIRVIKDYGSLPNVLCYPGKLNQAFLNIISNAIDAIPEKGEIIIKTSIDQNKIQIVIHDNGKGISPEIKDKIFDPFFTTKTVGQGVGLGLSITYSIIQEHNGSIDVKSDQKHGTEFTILLPCIT